MTLHHGHHHHPHSHAGHNHSDCHHFDPEQSHSTPVKSLTSVLVLTLGYFVIELVGGFWTNSLSLLGDAGHMFCDAGALLLAIFAAWLAQKPHSGNKTYGYHRAEMIAALLNGLLLWAMSAWILYEAWERLHTPYTIKPVGMMIIAGGGLIINLVSAFILHRQASENANIRAAWLHVLSDALGSFGALVSGLLIMMGFTSQIDSIVSVFITVLIVISAWQLIMQALQVLLEAAPSHLETDKIRQSILDFPQVSAVHDLHVWSITAGQESLSAHVVVHNEGDFKAELLQEIHTKLQSEFGLYHTTIQLEPPHFGPYVDGTERVHG